MAKNTPIAPKDSRQYQDEHYSPSQSFYDREFNDITRHYDDGAHQPLQEREPLTNNPDDLTNAEQNEKAQLDNQFGYKPSTNATDQPQTMTSRLQSIVKSIGGKKAAAGGSIAGLLITLVLGLFGGSQGILIHAKELFSDWGGGWNNSFHLRRSSILYQKKYFSDPAACGSVAIKCKLTAGVKDKDIAKLREAGLIIDDNDVMTSGNKKYLKKMSYKDITGKTVTVTVANFRQKYLSDSMLLSKFEYVASMKSITWRSSQALKKFVLFKVQRKDPIKEGANREETAKNMRQVQYGDGDTNTVKAVAGDESEDSTTKKGVAEFNSEIETQATALREKALNTGPSDDSVAITSGLDTSSPEVLKNVAVETSKSTVKGALFGAVAKIDSYCSFYQMIRIVSFGAKVYQMRALIKYAGLMATEADETKVGEMTPALAEFLGSLMVSGSVSAASKGKTFSDSDGLTLVTQGKVASPAGLARFTNGTPALNAITAVKGVLSQKGASAAVCSKVKSWYGQVGLAGVGIASTIATGGAGAVAGAAIGAADGVLLGVLGSYLTPKLIQYAAGVVAPDPLTDPEKGYGLGNAMAAGMGAFGSQVGRGNGLRFIKKNEFKSVLAQNNQDERTLAAADEINNPTNPTQDAFDNLAMTLLPLKSSLTSLNVTRFISSALSLQSASVSNVANAASPVDTYRGDLCKDEDYAQLNIATDAFCNPILAQTNQDIDSSKYAPDAVQNYMLANKYIDNEGNALGEYASFVSVCMDGDEPITADGYNADLSDANTRTCVSDDDKYQYFRFFTADNNILDAQDAGVEGTLGQAAGGSSDPTAVNVMTYNVLGPDHDNDGGVDYKQRLENIITTVNERSPDIIGFQEVNGAKDSYFQKKLISSLGTVYDEYPNDNQDAQQRPIYWKKSEYTLVDKGVYTYPRYDSNPAFMPWVKLKHTSGKTIYVFNTHTASGDRNHAKTVGGLTSPEARTVEIKALVAATKNVVKDGSPIIATGDYNSTCDVTNSDKPATLSEIPCTIMKEAGFKDAGETAASTGLSTINFNYATSHGAVGNQKETSGEEGRHIDHVFYNSDIQVKSWENIINNTTKNSSDHTPVIVALNVPGIANGTNAGSGSDVANGAAYVLGKDNWQKHTSSFLNSHYAGGGFLGSASSSDDISWGGIEGTEVHAIYGGEVVTQPLGRATYKCSGTPNVANNGGMTIKSIVDGKPVVIVYAHGKNVKFHKGDTVKTGDVIMEVGNVGNSCGAHLHMDGLYDNKNFCLQDFFVAMDKGAVDFPALTAKATPLCEGRSL